MLGPSHHRPVRTRSTADRGEMGYRPRRAKLRSVRISRTAHERLSQVTRRKADARRDETSDLEVLMVMDSSLSTPPEKTSWPDA